MNVKERNEGQTLQSGVRLDVSKHHSPDNIKAFKSFKSPLEYIESFKSNKIQMLQMFQLLTNRFDHDAKAGDVS